MLEAYPVIPSTPMPNDGEFLPSGGSANGLICSVRLF